MTEATYDLSPGRAPWLSFINKFGLYGKPLTQPKAMLKKWDLRDIFSYCDTVVTGKSVADQWTAFALIKMTTPTRPNLQDDMLVHPQDHLIIQETGQQVEIMMTPTEQIRIADGYAASCFFSFPDAFLTHGSTTASAAGTIVVKTVNNEPFKTFNHSQVINVGRSIHESQDIDPPSEHSDPIYDCNFAEHMEWGLQITEEMYNIVKTEGKMPYGIFTKENKDLLLKAQQQVEYKILAGTMSVDTKNKDGIKYTMDGLLPKLESNIMYYNKNTVGSRERLLSTFIADCANAKNIDPDGNDSKIYICGHDFYVGFNQDPNLQASRRLENDSGAITQELGFNINVYDIAGYKATLLKSEALRGKYSDWCFAIDPRMFKIRIFGNKNFTAPKNYEGAKSRVKKIMIEWAGTTQIEHEQTCALLRTV
jgi:hypothetical protein